MRVEQAALHLSAESSTVVCGYLIAANTDGASSLPCVVQTPRAEISPPSYILSSQNLVHTDFGFCFPICQPQLRNFLTTLGVIANVRGMRKKMSDLCTPYARMSCVPRPTFPSSVDLTSTNGLQLRTYLGSYAWPAQQPARPPHAPPPPHPPQRWRLHWRAVSLSDSAWPSLPDSRIHP